MKCVHSLMQFSSPLNLSILDSFHFSKYYYYHSFLCFWPPWGRQCVRLVIAVIAVCFHFAKITIYLLRNLPSFTEHLHNSIVPGWILVFDQVSCYRAQFDQIKSFEKRIRHFLFQDKKKEKKRKDNWSACINSSES